MVQLSRVSAFINNVFNKNGNLKLYLHEQQLHFRFVEKISMYPRLPDVRSKQTSAGTVPVSSMLYSKTNFSEISRNGSVMSDGT